MSEPGDQSSDLTEQPHQHADQSESNFPSSGSKELSMQLRVLIAWLRHRMQGADRLVSVIRVYLIQLFDQLASACGLGITEGWSSGSFTTFLFTAMVINA